MVLILDNIRSAYNVGSIFRTADAFGVSEIVCAGYTPTPEHAAVAKTGLQAESAVPWRTTATALEAVQALRAAGKRVFALELTPDAVELGSAVGGVDALVLGNETEGVSADALAACNGAVMIPMRGVKESLNVGVACGIALFGLR